MKKQPHHWSAAAVQRLRKKLKLSQEALARSLDVSSVTVNRWERGHTTPGKPACKALDALAKKGLEPG